MSQERDRPAFMLLHLFHGALARILVRAPPKESCAVSKTAAGEMIVRDFDDNLGRDRFPFAAALCAPTARASGRVASETGWFS